MLRSCTSTYSAQNEGPPLVHLSRVELTGVFGSKWYRVRSMKVLRYEMDLEFQWRWHHGGGRLRYIRSTGLGGDSDGAERATSQVPGHRTGRGSGT